MTSGYLLAAKARMEAEDKARAFAEVRVKAEYRPGHYSYARTQSAHSKLCEWEINGPWTGTALMPPPYKTRFLTPTGWIFIGCAAFWVGVIAWVIA